MENQEERGRVRGRDGEAGDRLKGEEGSKRQSKVNKEGKTEEANTKAAESSKRTFLRIEKRSRQSEGVAESQERKLEINSPSLFTVCARSFL